MDQPLDKPALTQEDKDTYFARIYMDTMKAQMAKVLLSFFVPIIYIIIRLIAKGNAPLLFEQSYKWLLIYSIIAMVITLAYGFTCIAQLEWILPTARERSQSLNGRRIFLGILEGGTKAIAYASWILLIYYIIFGVYSFWDFKHGFTIYPIAKFAVFTLPGLMGLLSLSHILHMTGKASGHNHDDAIKYIAQYNLYKQEDK